MILLSIQGPIFVPATCIYRQYSTDAVYQVNGGQLTYSQVRDTPPESRTLAHWAILVDWELQKTRPYVIVDPFDPSGLLYLSTSEYLVQARTLGSMNAPFIVICRPGSRKPVPIQTAPPERGFYSPFQTRFDPITWSRMKDLRTFIARNVTWGDGNTVTVNDGNIVGLVFVWTREILHYLHVKDPGRCQEQFLAFSRHLQDILAKNGRDFLIKRLKVLLFALYSYVGGNPLKSTEALGQRVRLSNGLPSIFGASMRESIRSGSLQRVRLWASLLNMYKYIEGTHGAPPLKTIQAPPFTGDITDFEDFCSSVNGFYRMMEKEIGQVDQFTYQSAAGLLITKAGANTSSAMTSFPYDAGAWASCPRNHALEWFEINDDIKMAGLLKKVMAEFTTEFGFHQIAKTLPPQLGLAFPSEERDLEGLLKNLPRLFPPMVDEAMLEWISAHGIEQCASMVNPQGLEACRSVLSRTQLNKDTLPGMSDDRFCYELWLRMKLGMWPKRVQTDRPRIGRLHPIQEPAGKVRVVAICDYFSQVGLYPVHEYLFKLLKRLPTDATFDQQGAVDRFTSQGYKDIYSYDLTAATDYIPKELYKPLMRPLLGEARMEIWFRLLQDREFWVNPKVFGEIPGSVVRYTRGQPMGAYSSWASLALVHHALVQYAARLAGHTAWFKDYLVLGDDIVIADSQVSAKYILICEKYGILVGLAKSYISHKGLCNFASQTVLGTENISPISLREELSSNSWSTRLEFAARMDHRWGGKRDDIVGSLRRVLTYPQWQALQGELTGKVWKHTLGLILFILQHPFRSGCHIGKITSWLGFLNPEFKKLPGGTTLELDRALRWALWHTLDTEVRRERNSVLALLEQTKKFAKLDAFGIDPLKVSWCYLGVKVAQDHFCDNIYSKVHEIWLWLGAYKMELPPQAELQWQWKIDTQAADLLPSLEELIEQWIRFSRIPRVPPRVSTSWNLKVHLHDLLKASQRAEERKDSSQESVRGVKTPRYTSVREGMAAPLGAILLAVGRVLGVKLPVFDLLSRQPPTRLRNALKLTLQSTINRWIVRDQSPCCLPADKVMGPTVHEVQETIETSLPSEGVSVKPKQPESAPPYLTGGPEQG